MESKSERLGQTSESEHSYSAVKMASINLLEELQLNDKYPQKLSFSEAIKLRGGETQTGSKEQYGLEIVRKLLMFDSTAVVSVTTKMIERLNNTGNEEAETKGQCVSDGARKRNTREKRGQCKIKVHPMDLLVVVMNCCDDFLRQILVEKMFANKLSIPILLPDVRNGSFTLLLFALRSLVSKVQDRTRESSATLTDALVDVNNPVVSFIRFGKLHRSKSKLVNDLLNPNSFNTFFHRECPNGSAKRLESNGSIEAAWFQSETEGEFNCRFFTALNLRGDATDYPKQTQFLCQSSTLTVLMVESFKSFKALYENILKPVDISQTKIIVCCISSESRDLDNETDFDLWNDSSGHGLLSEVNYDWNDEEQMSDVDFTNDLRTSIFTFFKPKHTHSDQMPTYTNIIQRGKNFGFSLDEDKLEYKSGKAGADDFIDLVLKLPPDCKPIILPLQGEPWKEIGRLEREQRGKSHDKSPGEHFTAEKETEKRHQRVMQCRRLVEKNETTQEFFSKFDLLQEQNLLYYLDFCKIKLDVRSRVFTSNFLEEYKEKQENLPQLSNEGESEGRLKEMELKIENSNIGLEHMLRECGQMYEAVISEDIRMKEELTKAPLTLAVIGNFPRIAARLLLIGQPLELMDGEASNVPITWLKEVLRHIKIITKDAMVFVLSIIGVQSSGKSTLLNALFGFQFPASAGRCTRGIYCRLVPVDKESLHSKYDYVLVVDTEGLGASDFTGKSTTRDNELATFAIGLADATIINMKEENWAEMNDILQIVAYGLIRVRKTKAELGLMPRCMFVHQNVPAVDAEEKNRLGQEKQLILLDKAIKNAAIAEGFTDINKFADVIKYDRGSHSWFFPDLWNGRPPKARISQDYIGKANELRQHVMQVMKDHPSKLRISSFLHRMSDLWNALLHNDFVLCFRNTQEIIAGTFLNDTISHEMDGFKKLNKPEQTQIRELICSFTSVETLGAEKDRILREMSDAVEKNFTILMATLQDVINATEMSAALKKKYKDSLKEIKDKELRRIIDETARDISVHMRKLEIGNDQRVKDLKARLAELEKNYAEEVQKDKKNETATTDFEESWKQRFADKKMLEDERLKSIEIEINETICGSIQKLYHIDNLRLGTVDLAPVVVEMPQVTQNDIAQNKGTSSGWVQDFSCSKFYACKTNNSLRIALKNWELQFQKQRDNEFAASFLKLLFRELGQLLGISAKQECEVRPRRDEICSILPPGYNFTRDYVIRFIKYVCHYTYNRSLENSKIFIAITNPLADIEERYLRSVRNFQLMTVEANIDAVSKQIFDFSKRSFVRDLGELLKTEVCKEENPTFKSKRAFLRTILTDLGEKIHNVAQVYEEKQIIFKEFMLYVELAESDDSAAFFLDVILKLLKEMLAKECENAPETHFQKMVENNVGRVIEMAKNVLRQADTNCNGSAREYIQIFKDVMNVTSEIDFRVNILVGFTEAVLLKIDNLYTEFLSQANSSFETLVCEENKAAIRTVFERIMGCRAKCPFCSAPCSQSLQQHAGEHRANHYPMGVRGTVKCKGFFTNTEETRDAFDEKQRKPRKLVKSTCQAMVGTRVDIRTLVTVNKATKWYQSDYQPFKKYKEMDEYKDWDIPYCRDHNASLYWKWFMTQFVEELAEHHEALSPTIPEAWKKVTWEEAIASLDEPEFNFNLSVQEQCS